MPLTPIVIKDAPQEFQPFLKQADDFEGSDAEQGTINAEKEIIKAIEDACNLDRMAEDLKKGTIEGDKDKFIGAAKRCNGLINYANSAGFALNTHAYFLGGRASFMSGEHLLQMGRLKEALESVDAALKIKADDAYALYTKGLILIHMGDAKEAVIWLKEALKLKPDKKMEVLLYKKICFAEMEDGNYEEAHRFLDKAMKIAANDADLYVLLAKLSLFENDIKKARSVLEKAFSIDPKSASANQAMGMIEREQKNYESAIAYFEKAAELTPDNERQALIDYYVGLAKTYDSCHDVNNAIKYVDMALKLSHQSVRANLIMGSILHDTGKFDEAIKYFDAVLAINPRQLTAMAWKGIALVYLERYADAEIYLEKAIELAPNDSDWLRFLAIAEGGVRKHDNALKHIDMSIKIDPTYTYTYSVKGALLEAIGRNEEALVEYRKALTLDGKNLRALIGMGDILRKGEKYADAIPFYDAAIAQEPRNADLLYYKGLCLAFLGDHSKARELFLRSLEIDPEKTHVLSNIASTFFEEKNYEEAAKYLLRSGDHFFRGIALMNLGGYKEAIEAFDKAIQLEIGDEGYMAAVHNKKGLAHWMLNEYDNAINEFDTVQVVLPNEVISCYYKIAVLFDAKRFSEAIALFNEKKELFESLPFPPYYFVGEAYYKLGKTAEAKLYYDKIKDGDQFGKESLIAKTVLLLDGGDFTSALRVAQEAESKYPKTPDFPVFIGRVFAEWGDWTATSEALRRGEEKGGSLDDKTMPIIDETIKIVKEKRNNENGKNVDVLNELLKILKAISGAFTKGVKILPGMEFKGFHYEHVNKLPIEEQSGPFRGPWQMPMKTYNINP